jgi:hypothetical protein
LHATQLARHASIANVFSVTQSCTFHVPALCSKNFLLLESGKLGVGVGIVKAFERVLEMGRFEIPDAFLGCLRWNIYGVRALLECSFLLGRLTLRVGVDESVRFVVGMNQEGALNVHHFEVDVALFATPNEMHKPPVPWSLLILMVAAQEVGFHPVNLVLQGFRMQSWILCGQGEFH